MLRMDIRTSGYDSASCYLRCVRACYLCILIYLLPYNTNNVPLLEQRKLSVLRFDCKNDDPAGSQWVHGGPFPDKNNECWRI
ncbi:hypothetical protein BT96DRAFT_254119 [Gymnopus androsaceus JB14]|uniref:Uncharacterized protein n=1 Tax=Gymnopus androsaceus JB14 TaxID=1447944 RepID=A0A6A4I7F7_9AGAR|nr:hypothetical protein BT96DRAFT_254119 [Gymnopus androsaceus JB14]